MANNDAFKITLTNEHIRYIESILPFDPGFSNTFIVGISTVKILDFI